MLAHRLYYLLKPYTPWGLRMTLRRPLARRLWRKHVATWPIDPTASRTPDRWPGWPDGKRFAFVLTHDVEGKRGLDRCRHLATAERALGFRSSFNFIPQGPYRVSPELRSWLAAQGFEVGVHDLRHDGWLFSSETSFEQSAAVINEHLAEWGAVGFRSGFMLRNLEWLHRLNLRYDASTFDTDPFEWQSDGARTIFPFFIQRSEMPGAVRSGYAELPYTLPQDSTLFLLLQQSTNQIWREKLDWIAQHGGMALLNVHPDYLHHHTGAKRTTVEQHYLDLLTYLRTTYPNQYWQPLPHELAEFVWSNQPASSFPIPSLR